MKKCLMKNEYESNELVNFTKKNSRRYLPLGGPVLIRRPDKKYRIP